MRDPNLNIDRNSTGQRPAAMAHGAEPRRSQNKAVRVAFGPDLDIYIPPRGDSPLPVQEQHAPFNAVEQRPDVGSMTLRPTSSSGENITASEEVSDLPSDRVLGGGRPIPALQRAKSDYGPRAGAEKSSPGEDDDLEMRHGWQEEYTSSEYLKVLHSVSMETICLP